jgi:ribonuclease HI
MKEANYRGWDKVQFESDSHVLVEAIQTRRGG